MTLHDCLGFQRHDVINVRKLPIKFVSQHNELGLQ